ncbi:hypothetical protein ACLI4Y_09210 [Natrialbaceae archaeon A-CW3]
MTSIDETGTCSPLEAAFPDTSPVSSIETTPTTFVGWLEQYRHEVRTR